MDWQQIAALLVVASTALCFVLSRMQKRRGVALKKGACGCGTEAIGPQQTVTFRARKGERPQIIIKNQASNGLL